MTRAQLHGVMEGNGIGTYDQATEAIEYVMDMLDLQIINAIEAEDSLQRILTLNASRKAVRELLYTTEPYMSEEVQT